MYYYYVRYSIFNKKKKKIRDGSQEIGLPKEVTEENDILKMKRLISNRIKIDIFGVNVDDVMIDFYQLLRIES